MKPYGFDYLWLDETEPDIDPANDVFWVGSGPRYYNTYPLFHTASVYEGFRRDFGDSRRVMILARAAYLGAQRNGTVFWSSDIFSTWDMLKRSIPAGLNFTASGMPYWDTDIAGFFSPNLANYHAAHKPLIDASDARKPWATMKTIPSYSCAGSSGEHSSPSCVRTARGCITKCGRTANRRKPSWKSICGCDIS